MSVIAFPKANLVVANRDPGELDEGDFQFWLNWSTRELFELRDKWVSVSEEFVEINPIRGDHVRKPI